MVRNRLIGHADQLLKIFSRNFCVQRQKLILLGEDGQVPRGYAAPLNHPVRRQKINSVSKTVSFMQPDRSFGQRSFWMNLFPRHPEYNIPQALSKNLGWHGPSQVQQMILESFAGGRDILTEVGNPTGVSSAFLLGAVIAVLNTNTTSTRPSFLMICKDRNGILSLQTIFNTAFPMHEFPSLHKSIMFTDSVEEIMNRSQDEKNQPIALITSPQCLQAYIECFSIRKLRTVVLDDIDSHITINKGLGLLSMVERFMFKLAETCHGALHHCNEYWIKTKFITVYASIQDQFNGYTAKLRVRRWVQLPLAIRKPKVSEALPSDRREAIVFDENGNITDHLTIQQGPVSTETEEADPEANPQLQLGVYGVDSELVNQGMLETLVSYCLDPANRATRVLVFVMNGASNSGFIEEVKRIAKNSNRSPRIESVTSLLEAAAKGDKCADPEPNRDVHIVVANSVESYGYHVGGLSHIFYFGVPVSSSVDRQMASRGDLSGNYKIITLAAREHLPHLAKIWSRPELQRQFTDRNYAEDLRQHEESWA